MSRMWKNPLHHAGDLHVSTGEGQGVFRIGDRGLLADTAGAWCAISEKCKSDPVFGCVMRR